MRMITENPNTKIPELRESDMHTNLIVAIVSDTQLIYAKMLPDNCINWNGTRTNRLIGFELWGFEERYTGILNFIMRSWHYWGDICSSRVIMYVVENEADIDYIIENHTITNPEVLTKLARQLRLVRGGEGFHAGN